MIEALAAVLLNAVNFQPCEVQGLQVECGTVSVPENRTATAARRIGLHVVVSRHEPAKKSADAVFVLAGGPGLGASYLTSAAIKLLAGAGRDLVLVDLRGTGRSSPLRCDLGGSDADVAGYVNDFLPVDRVVACRQALAGRVDLTQYTTRAAADDLEDVRRQLGYEKIDLHATSYGTRLAQQFMRRHPRSVRMAVLFAVVAPSRTISGSFATDGQRSLDRILALCSTDAVCREAYPDLKSDYNAMLRRVATGVHVEIEDATTREPVRLTINRGLFGEVVRNLLYSPDGYVRVPHVVHRAARNDFSEFAHAALRYARSTRQLDFGLFLSVTCAEDMPRIDLSAATKAAEGTLFGAYRVEQQAAACRGWPRGEPDPQHAIPVRSSIPTLLVSGELDPITPPHYADEVIAGLSDAVHLIVPYGSHSGARGCVDAIVIAALRQGTARNLDLSCVRAIARPAFRTES
jgi:pimeloyl-ACP methyl ester carboxylesterase